MCMRYYGYSTHDDEVISYFDMLLQDPGFNALTPQRCCVDCNPCSVIQLICIYELLHCEELVLCNVQSMLCSMYSMLCSV